MANSRPPGPLGTFVDSRNVDDGTHFRGQSPLPGPIGAFPDRGPGRNGQSNPNLNRGPRAMPPLPPMQPGSSHNSAPATTAQSVANWPLEDKFGDVLRRTAAKLPEGLREEFAALLTATNIAIMAGTLALWAASHLIGIGAIIDILLLVTGAIFFGMAVFEVLDDLLECINGTVKAKTMAELDQAASHLARVISIIGVAAFMALLAKVGAKVRSSPSGQTGAGGAGGSAGASGSGAVRPKGDASGTGSTGQSKSAGAANGDAGAGTPGQGKAATQEAASGQGKKACACVTAGHPVDVINGSKVLLGPAELDFSLAAPLPLHWQRQYSSDNPVVGWFGQGWSGPFSLALQLSQQHITLLDAQHREITFPLLAPGEDFYSRHEQITLSRISVTEFLLIDKDAIRNHFHLPGPQTNIAHLVSQNDRNGNQIRIEYEGTQPKRIIDAAGRTLQLKFDAQQRLLAVTELREGEGALPTPVALVQYQYSEAGDLVKVINRLGQTTREFAYQNHIMVKHAQPGGLVSEYEYTETSPKGKVLINRTNDGQVWRFTYANKKTLVTDTLGRREYHLFDENRRYTGHTNALGQKTVHELDSFGSLRELRTPAGVVRYQYDYRSRVTRIEQPDGSQTQIKWDDLAEQPATITDAMGHTRQFQYDQRANLVASTDALGQRTGYRYDERGLPVEIIDANVASKHLKYNKAGQLIEYRDCSNQTSRYEYDENGHLRATIDALGQATRYQHDATGKLLAASYPDGSSERFEYDALGRLIGHVDANGHSTRYALDAEGRVLARSNAIGGKLQYQYDGGKRLVQLVNENGAIYAFGYDPLDRLVQETGFDARTTRYTYDAAGQPQSKTELGITDPHAPLGTPEHTIETVYRRDAMGRLLEKTVSGGSPAQKLAGNLTTRYQYDAIGRLIEAENASATVKLRYDAIGQIIAETSTPINAPASTVRYQYDPLGNRIQTTLPDGRLLKFLHYGSGHLHQINLDGKVISDMERDAAHREISRTQGALTSQFQYDPVGRLKAQLVQLDPARSTLAGVGAQGNTIARQYQYDPSGNLTAILDQRLGTTNYQYDPVGRILSATAPNLAETFAFDPANNLLDPATSQTADSAGRLVNNQITVFEDKRYRYDPHGNLIDKKIARHTQLQLRWNAEHQLVESQTTRNLQQPTPTTQQTEYGYDPFGRRIFKRDAFGCTRFVWDGNRLLAEVRGSHVRTYVYSGNSFVPLAQVDSDSDANAPTTAPASGVPKNSAQVLYVHTDHLGTPRELTDEIGNLRWAASYKAWGNVFRLEMPQETNKTSIAPTEPLQVLRFQGQYFDVETGLHYNRFRYYDPDCGRFISQDPIGLKGGNNLYQYAPNPCTWVDPMGLSPIDPLVYVLKPQDLDWRGSGKTTQAALNEAFNRTGVPKEEFNVTKWGENEYGKSIPVEYRAPGGAEVNIDFAHTPGRGPDAPHIGWQTPGKNNTIGHIVMDDVPTGRSKCKVKC